MLCPTLLNCLKLSEKYFIMTKNFPSPKVQKHKNANISGTVGHRAKKIIYSSFVTFATFFGLALLGITKNNNLFESFPVLGPNFGVLVPQDTKNRLKFTKISCCTFLSMTKIFLKTFPVQRPSLGSQYLKTHKIANIFSLTLYLTNVGAFVLRNCKIVQNFVNDRYLAVHSVLIFQAESGWIIPEYTWRNVNWSLYL